MVGKVSGHGMLETSYGEAKRLELLVDICRARGCETVLDIGCGTGGYLTYPLALEMPGLKVVGMDADLGTINFARENFKAENLEFVTDGELGPAEKFDLIVASEVLEHVDAADAFLETIRSTMKDGGAAFITVPNGYGPFELVSFLYATLNFLGVVNAVKRLLRRGGAGGPSHGAIEGHTLAHSPHINFFGWSQIGRLFARAGLTAVLSRNRTFLCGYGLSGLVRRLRLTQWNADVADRMHPRLVSGWMFLLEHADPRPLPGYRRGWLSRVRKFLNQRPLP